MDNIGDWLYLVFIIIAAISSIFSSGKKNKQSKEILGQPGKVIVTPQEKRVKKKIEKTEMASKSLKETKKQPVQTQQKFSQPTITPTFLQGEYVTEHTPMKGTITASFIETEPDNKPAFNFNDTDDLKKAVIYAEILNRKY